jgi:CheY-like chemotaxis protein
MNGDIRVKSTVDKGTEFEFYTIHKITDGMKEEQETPSLATVESIVGMKVLLVEDNDINQLIIRDILHELGLKVIITSNGAEAMEIISSQFDFVLMDIQMPVMNGIMAMRLIKQQEDLKHIPIIALTANVMPEQIESYYAEGFDGYCSKPIMVNELVQTLRLMFEKYHKHK